MNRIAFLLVAVFPFGLPSARADEELSPEEAVRGALRTPLPEGPHLAAKAYGKLFSGATEAKLRGFAKSANLSIALQARFELRGTNHPLPSDPAHLYYLPEFLEGDLGLPVPLPWVVHFATVWYGNALKFDAAAEFYRRAGYEGIGERMKVTFTSKGTTKEIGLHTYQIQPDQHRTSYGPLAAKNVEITKDGTNVNIQVEGRAIRVSEDAFLKSERPFESRTPERQIVAAAIHSNHAYVAACPDSFAPGLLTCVDLPSGRIVWSSVIWATCADWTPAMSGLVYYDVQLTCDDKRIAVFGRGSHCPFFIESFDARTGESQVRFSSRYWDCRK